MIPELLWMRELEVPKCLKHMSLLQRDELAPKIVEIGLNLFAIEKHCTRL